MQDFEKQLDELKQHGRPNCRVLHGSGINRQSKLQLVCE